MPAPWITYRPELKVLDCTIRDGGLVNNHQFEDGFVRAVYETCVNAGIDYMEIGYRNSKQDLCAGQAWTCGCIAKKTISVGLSAMGIQT